MTPIEALTQREIEEGRKKLASLAGLPPMQEQKPVVAVPVATNPTPALAAQVAPIPAVTPTVPTEVLSEVPAFLRRVEADLEAAAKKLTGK